MDDGLSFEEALSRLEQITQSLEQGGLKLEEAIALFEEGMELARVCHQRLSEAELKLSDLQAPMEQTPDEEQTDAQH